MGFTYEIKPSGGDIHESNPYWFAGFVRFRNRDTFTRDRMTNSPEDSSRDGAGAIDEMPTLIAIDDVTAWSVESGKTSHTSHCSMTLTNGRRNYVAELAPGDWACFWAFDNRSDFERVLRAVRSKSRANGWNDGLKFVGRVNSVQRQRNRSMDGKMTVSYSVSCTGFGEFDSFIYYNPIIKAKYGDNALRWMMDFGGAANNLILGTSLSRGLITSQDVIPKLIKICLGIGPFSDNNSMPTNQVEISDDYKGTTPGTLQGSPNRGYLVPATIGRWLLGAESLDTIKDVGLTYVDLLRAYVGIQRFSGTGIFPAKPTTEEPWRGFLPDIKKTDQNTYLMRDDLSGEYRILTLHFDNKSVWSLLQSYVNEPVDEMYTCMRVDHTGHVMPSVVARQIPFSTNWMAANSKWTVTPFPELPRWKISTDMLVDEKAGRSDAMRFNYLHFIGQDMTGSNTEKNGILNYVRNPPVVDSTDINRSGLRSYIKQLNANVNEGQYNNDTSPGAKWQQIMADILMGGHLKYSGTITSKGIQAPIAEGDNLEFENTLYHIERVQHGGGITLLGHREWTTTMSLSNGISTDVENSDAEIVYPDLDTKPDQMATILERVET
jgi:hypothetical protein